MLLLESNSTSWNHRLKILMRVVEGMCYLQEGWPEVGYDLRTSSILLAMICLRDPYSSISFILATKHCRYHPQSFFSVDPDSNPPIQPFSGDPNANIPYHLHLHQNQETESEICITMEIVTGSRSIKLSSLKQATTDDLFIPLLNLSMVNNLGFFYFIL
ncbi:hypothetical protein C1H46_027276 [Malus baccata]|uniref:Uncharacterized protein n=1 Tax=Malus baccata TaxID=106549 RepID=A0A540LKY1_MALBA|nr:hypothetical protein C1H46_027276 [Malus baccata]